MGLSGQGGEEVLGRNGSGEIYDKNQDMDFLIKNIILYFYIIKVLLCVFFFEYYFLYLIEFELFILEYYIV